jgi:hypothetical protein
MKKIYSLLICCSFTALGFAQVEVTESGQSTDISGTTWTKIVDQAGNVAFPMQIRNVSGNAASLNITRVRLDHPASWEDGLTWQSEDFGSGAGYASPQMATNPWTTPFAVQLQDNGWGWFNCSIHVDVPGTGTYRYYMEEAGGMVVDSVDLQVIYSTVGVEELEVVKGMTAYPNPANDLLTVNATGLEDYRIRMTDVLGKVVYDEAASAPKKAIDVSDMKNGVYMVTVLEKGTVIRTRRVVVKH